MKKRIIAYGLLALIFLGALSYRWLCPGPGVTMLTVAGVGTPTPVNPRSRNPNSIDFGGRPDG